MEHRLIQTSYYVIGHGVDDMLTIRLIEDGNNMYKIIMYSVLNDKEEEELYELLKRRHEERLLKNES